MNALSCLNRAIPDSTIHPTGFQLIEWITKTRGGGLCFYTNEGWCTDMSVLKKVCCTNFIRVFLVYSSECIHSSFLMSATQEKLADQITQSYPDSFIIIFCDFNKLISPVNCLHTLHPPYITHHPSHQHTAHHMPHHCFKGHIPFCHPSGSGTL